MPQTAVDYPHRAGSQSVVNIEGRAGRVGRDLAESARTPLAASPVARTRKRKPSPKPSTPAPAPAPAPVRGSALRKYAWPALTVVLALAAGIAATILWKPTGQPATTAQGNAEFVGSAACKECHADAYRAWTGSQHQLAMQHATEATVRGDFNDAKFRYVDVESTFFRRDGKFFVRTDGPDGALADFEIKYTFGVYPLQQYLVEFPDGRIQALSIAWDTRPREAGGQRWFHLYPKERVDFRDELHWTKLAQNWNFMCADCHSTNLRKNYDAARNTFHTEWSEISVGCEACHGPGSRHLEWTKAKTADPARGLTVMLDERHGVTWKSDPATGNATRSEIRRTDREIEVCAQCHARRAQIGEGYHAGKPFLDYYRPALLSAGLYYPDGQQRDEVYIWGSFLQSRMYRAGVTCSDCHEPHSQKLRAEGNAVCAQCHLPAKYDAPSHHFHKAGARCADCHMPTTTYMVVDPRRDHSLRIPRPDLSVSLGVPNACNKCHVDKTAQWADDAVRKWYGHQPEGFQHFAATLAGAERGAANAAGNLAVLSGDLSQPAIARATAAEDLAPYASQASLAALQRGVVDADPLVRRASVSALAFLPAEQRVPLVAPLLDDPVRIVRIEAASSLAGVPDSALDPAQRASFARAAAEFEAVQLYNADRPEARTALGGFYAQRGRHAQAEKQLEAAIAMDPRYVPAYVNLADMRRAQGRDAAGEEALRDGLKHVPDSAALYHALGLSLARQKRMPEALDALARAAGLAPDDARFAYVYAVALNSNGKARAALAEIDRALARHPDDRDLLNAGAAFARDAGDGEAMARYAKRLAALK
jgi:tetratricopeptide (TPR) repeat protein